LTRILDGKVVAAALKAKLAAKAGDLAKEGAACGLAIVRVGDDPASKVYTNALVKLATTLGVKAAVRELGADAAAQQVVAVIEELNNDNNVTGILPMMPMPSQIKPDVIARAILPRKDVDGISPLNAGLVANGNGQWAPCTARAVMEILDFYGIDLAGRRVVIIGRSNVVGKPVALLMLGRNATVTICHSKTENLGDVVRQSDVVVAAVGRPGLVTADMLKPGVIVVDVGINEVDGKIVGDVDFASAEKLAGAITPVPGGVGAVSNVMVIDAVLRGFEGKP
jgi:methylenetetrahydrofolate dehydrogenase (NADP+)/methenyltetrahydrofolate cyclohydrolase